jgi:hypothetical protein
LMRRLRERRSMCILASTIKETLSLVIIMALDDARRKLTYRNCVVDSPILVMP